VRLDPRLGLTGGRLHSIFCFTDDDESSFMERALYLLKGEAAKGQINKLLIKWTVIHVGYHVLLTFSSQGDTSNEEVELLLALSTDICLHLLLLSLF
jgi:hypothetical protein